jgi:hypothetical protein
MRSLNFQRTQSSQQKYGPEVYSASNRNVILNLTVRRSYRVLKKDVTKSVETFTRAMTAASERKILELSP